MTDAIALLSVVAGVCFIAWGALPQRRPPQKAAPHPKPRRTKRD